MSVRYGQYVLPAPEHLDFRPTRAQLRSVLAGLLGLGWLRPEGAFSASDRSLYVLPSDLDSRLEVPDTGLLALWLAGGPPGRYPEEFARADAFGPQYCEDITIYDSPVAATLPAGMNGAELLCPSCSEDIYPIVSRSPSRAERPELRELLGNGFSVAPERCPRCRQGIDLAKAVMELDAGRADQAPFGRFILVFQAVHAPDELVRLDPAVLPMLLAACGVPFRETGRFE